MDSWAPFETWIFSYLHRWGVYLEFSESFGTGAEPREDHKTCRFQQVRPSETSIWPSYDRRRGTAMVGLFARSGAGIGQIGPKREFFYMWAKKCPKMVVIARFWPKLAGASQAWTITVLHYHDVTTGALLRGKRARILKCKRA